MENNLQDHIRISKKDAAKFIKDYSFACYAIQLFSFLAEIKKLEIHLETDEVCELFNITRRRLEECRRKGEVRSFVFGGVRCYNAYDIVVLAEKINRTERFKQLLRNGRL